MGIIESAYLVYGMYFAGKSFRGEGTPKDGHEVCAVLILAILYTVAWPLFMGLGKHPTTEAKGRE